MKKNLVFISLICNIFGLSASSHVFLEKDSQKAWCSAQQGKMEVILPDKARVDCVLPEYAIEFDFASKWGEAIGQSLYYGAVLNRKPGIVLIMENGSKDNKYLERLNKVANTHGITVWTMAPSQVNIR